MRPLPAPRRRGFALEATLAVLLLLVVLSAAAATGAATMVRTSAVDQSATRVTYAVDAAADNIMSQLLFLVQRFGVPTQQQLDSLRRPNFTSGSLNGVTIQQTARRVGAATNDSIRSGPYAGLIAQYASYDLDVTATDRAANASRAIVRIESQLIPIFQFGVFFEKDLEITAGQVFTFLGRVHTNGNMYLCPSANRMYFLEYLTTPNRYIQNRKDANQTGCNRNAGAANQILMSRSTPVTAPPLPADTARITFDNRGSGNTTCCASPANDNRFRDSSQARLGGRLQTRAHGVDSLNLPLPGDSIDPRELIRPRNLSLDGSALQGVKYSWMADWSLTIDWNNIGGLCANITSPTWSARSVGRDVPVGADCTAIFGVSQFFDGREGNRVRVLTINMGNLRSWILADSARRTTEIMYITFVGTNNPAEPSGLGVLGAGSQANLAGVPTQPAVRLENAARLHSRFTLATSHPLYVYGDYNFDRTSMADTASRWRPSSLVADAFTLLSPTWTDANNATAGSNNDPSSAITYVRAAVAAGHSPTYRSGFNPTNADWFDVGGTNYGGGLENFPRFLENFGSGRIVNFGGSLVSLWYSAYANWDWGGGYYTPPTRVWSFDTRFRLPENLPPGTPKVGSVYQIAYRPVY